jgi:hypothetical protein
MAKKLDCQKKATMNPIDLCSNVTEPQMRFHLLTSKFSAFVGGLGSGKTEALLNQALIDASHSPDAMISLYQPTFDLLRKTIAPRLIEKLDYYKIRHRWNKQENIIYTKHKQFGSFVLQSLEKPERIVSFQSYRSHIDEFDTLKLEHAQLAWRKILGRNRQKPAGIKNPFNRVSIYTSPEGFRFVYKRFVANKQKNYEMVQAPSYSNPFLPAGYIESLMGDYPPQLVRAYVEGEFVNLTSGTIYNCYDREAHNTSETIRPRETLFIGNDFNITKMAASIYVRREGGMHWHCVNELVNLYDTPELARVIKERWKDNGHHIVIYPDASGSKRNPVSGNQSDISILRQNGFEVRVNPSNPSVRDRINATNAAFTKGVLFINADKCPTVANCLEQQVYDSNGEPLKDGVDHQNDATTYPIVHEMPIKRHSHINVRF